MRYLYVFILWVFFLPLMGTAQSSLIQSGPMLGYVEMMEAGVWVQTTESAKVSLRYVMKGTTDSLFTDPFSTQGEQDFIAKFLLTDLAPGSTYSYTIFINNRPVSLPYSTELTTQTLWNWRSPAPDFTFATGSCLFINDPEYDRPGKGYGDEYFILESIADKNPDFMLWTGDNVYYRDPDFYSRARLSYRNKHTRSIAEMQRLLATTAHYAIWDDHDFGPNNSNRSYRLKDDALELFNAYWFNPSAGHDGEKGIYFNFIWNDVEFFMMDDRYHRAPNKIKDETKDFWGEKQLQWLLDGLASSYAPFKVIVNGNQTINLNNPYEGMQDYKRELESLLSFIEETKIEGVVFMSGDRHHTELLKLDREGLYPLYEFTNSPLTSGFNANLREPELTNTLRVEGTLTNTTRNFGLVNVSGERRNRLMTIQTYDSKGELLWEYKISEKELKFPSSN